MKGFAVTPDSTVDCMIDLLFRDRAPSRRSRVLDPGCGTGAFIDGIMRWCKRRGIDAPQILGVELDPARFDESRQRFSEHANISIVNRDFLDGSTDEFNFIVGNPPYVAITGLSATEKAHYRLRYATARGRFDLYMLFFEQALEQLAADGRLVFITPEKFMYVDTAGPLRHLLAGRHIEEVRLVNEQTFGSLVTYPTITTVVATEPAMTRVVLRDESVRIISIPLGVKSWQSVVAGQDASTDHQTLVNVCRRLSCGIATGADNVFIHDTATLPQALRDFASPTISGRELVSTRSDFRSFKSLLIPYDSMGGLLPADGLGALGDFLKSSDNYSRLIARTCVARKPWYAFHETPDLAEILKPKILWKDITSDPHFWLDASGEIVPRHSVYYLVPKRPEMIHAILDYLRSASAKRWIVDNCQRAAKGYLRMQSAVLKRLPIPDSLAFEGEECEASAPHQGDFQIAESMGSRVPLQPVA